jgi:hypothetical protein
MRADRSGRISVPAILATAAVIVVVVAALITLGNPSIARQQRLDTRRVRDLIKISGAIDAYWSRRTLLPPSLDSLASAHDLTTVPHDPVTKVPYTYSVTAAGTYRICATFEQPSDDQADQYIIRYGLNVRRWQHAVGFTCFDITAHAYAR